MSANEPPCRAARCLACDEPLPEGHAFDAACPKCGGAVRRPVDPVGLGPEDLWTGITDEELILDGQICAAATPGPWYRSQGTPEYVYRLDPVSGDRTTIACMSAFDGRADARFIAHTRTAFPAMLHEVRSLRAENARLRSLFAEFARAADMAGAEIIRAWAREAELPPQPQEPEGEHDHEREHGQEGAGDGVVHGPPSPPGLPAPCATPEPPR